MSAGLDLPGADEESIRSILADAETWAVVGLSTNRRRAAYGVATFLQQHGKRIIPVHPKAETVHGEPGFRTLAEVDSPIDCVDVFVRSELAGRIAEQAISVGAGSVWFQLGVIDAEAYRRVTGAGIAMVMDRCPAIEWPRLGPAA